MLTFRLAWRVSVRRGSAVEKSRHAWLAEALDVVAAAAHDAARDERRSSVDLRVRSYTPSEQVVARITVAGPHTLSPGARGGVVVHGDGSMTAFTGRNATVEPQSGESPVEALRRVLGEEGGRR